MSISSVTTLTTATASYGYGQATAQKTLETTIIYGWNPESLPELSPTKCGVFFYLFSKMIKKTFRNIFRFQVFVPEKHGWLKYRRSLSRDYSWICEFSSQDGTIQKSRILTEAYAEEIWHRFKSQDTCETIYVS